MTTISRLGNFRQHRYTISLVLVPAGAGASTSILLSEYVTELRIFKDFDNNVFPYYRVNVGVSVETARQIQECWRKARLYLSVEKWYVPDGYEPGDALIDAFDEYLKSVEFQIMTLDGSPPKTSAYQESNMSRDVPSVTMSMEISPTLALSVNKKINNGVFHSVSLGEIAMHLTADNKPEAKRYPFFFAPPDNPKKYENVMMPPLTYVRALRYLDEVHGIYAGTLSVFLDADAGYILSSTKKIVPDRGIKSVVLEILSSDQAGPGDTAGSEFNAETGTIRLRTGQRPEILADGPARKETVGEAIKLVEANHREKSGSDCKKLLPDNIESATKPKERVAWQAYDNPLAIEKMRVANRENYAPSTLRFDGVDLAAFAPGLEWKVVAEDADLANLEGAWRVKAVEIVLQKNQGSTESSEPHISVTIVPTTLNKDSTLK